MDDIDWKDSSHQVCHLRRSDDISLFLVVKIKLGANAC